MRILPSLSVLLLAVCAGCAQPHSTSAMGAGPADSERVMCRDGAWTTTAAGCAGHSGVERDMSSSTPK